MSQHPYATPEPHISDVNQQIVEEFRANSGRVGGPFEGAQLLLLTTVGARSGREHTTPLGYIRDDERVLVIGSAGGSPRHPDWYHNLLAHPMVRVEIGTDTFDAVAVPAEGAEHDRLIEKIVREAPGYGEYQVGLARRLPVVTLERPYIEAGPEQVRTFADKLIEIHTWLRGQLSHVSTEADAHFAARAGGNGAREVPPVGLNLQIRQHCLAFCESLHFHHTMEDEYMLPDLERRHPNLREAIQRLRAEHRTVDRIRGDLVALLADVGSADPDRFRADLDRMSRELVAHLDHEEASLIPIFAEIPFPPQPPDGGGPPAGERA
ncbi:MAG TPA: nitroreductase/quinone reductase family protein [Euzebyales bacterium]|nr:nitroreductase/quinone reductase family protein [Euzebyales bacterium]